MATKQTEEIAITLKDAALISLLIQELGIANKADKVAGKGFSQEDFTTALKTKLDGIHGSHFKGVHKTLAELETASPAASAEAGAYAYIKDTGDEKVAMLDSGAWVELSAGGQPLTAAQLKILYESNADTNVFSDGDKANITTLFNRVKGLDAVPADTNATVDYKKKDHLEVTGDIALTGDQTLPQTPTEMMKDNRLITVKNAFTIEAALKQWTLQNAMIVNSDTPITDVTKIADSGMFYGGKTNADHTTTDVLNSPVQGAIMVMASKDKDGNFGYFLMGTDEILHTGGKPAGATAIKWSKIFNQNELGDLHTYVAGSTLTAKLDELKQQLDKVSHSTSTTKKDPAWAATVPVDGEAGGFVMAYFNTPVANPANPGQDIADGTAHYLKFSEKDHPCTSTAWIWINDSGGQTKRLWTNAAKTTAVDGLSMGVYIRKGALIKVQKENSEWFVKDVIIPAVPQGTVKAVLSDGSVKMKSGYAPADDLDVATKKSVEDAVKGKVAMEAGYTPSADLSIATKKSVEDAVATIKIPANPTADGDYKLHIAGGVATWVSA